MIGIPEPAAGWRTLTNLVLPSSPFLLFDSTAPGQPKRFYRVSGSMR